MMALGARKSSSTPHKLIPKALEHHSTRTRHTQVQTLTFSLDTCMHSPLSSTRHAPTIVDYTTYHHKKHEQPRPHTTALRPHMAHTTYAQHETRILCCEETPTIATTLNLGLDGRHLVSVRGKPPPIQHRQHPHNNNTPHPRRTNTPVEVILDGANVDHLP